MLKFAHTIEDMPNAFSPRELSGDDLNTYYYDKTMPVRTGNVKRNPIGKIYRFCHDASNRNKYLFLGHRGCGKSTELNVLSRRFQEEGFPVHTIQCSKDLDMVRPLYSDLLILMGNALIKIAEEKEYEVDLELLKRLVHYWDTIREVQTQIQAIDGSFEGGIKAETPKFLKSVLSLFATIQSSVKLGSEYRTEYEERIDNRLGDWIVIVNQLADTITKQASGKQPIIIFEELDKLADLDSEQNEKDKSWNLFFERPTVLADFSFPIIYTFPIALSYESRFNALKGYFEFEFFPMIKVKTINDERCEEGFNAIRQIIRMRANPDLFESPEVEDLLIEKTGGTLRDLFDAIRLSAIYARGGGADKIGMEDAVLALEEIQSEITRRIDSRDYPFLKDIYNGNRKGISDKKALLEKLLAGVVLEYNGTRWCNLHPLVADYLVDLGQVKKKEESGREPTVGEEASEK